MEIGKINGLDELREWLQANGFKIEINNNSQNDCNWRAYRRATGQTRECETNDGKLMLVVNPYQFRMHDYAGGCFRTHSTVETEITGEAGEAGGRWYKLQQYATSPDEFMANLAEIERALVNAWNAVVSV